MELEEEDKRSDFVSLSPEGLVARDEEATSGVSISWQGLDSVS